MGHQPVPIRRLKRVDGPIDSAHPWRVEVGGGPREVVAVHLVGVCGSGMLGLAGLFLERGLQVSGSDMHAAAGLSDLVGRGLVFYEGQRRENVHAAVDMCVHSAAVPPDNPEREAAATLGLPDIKYARALGLLMSERRGIAVAGTHGKTTTTAMLAWILRHTGADPSFVVGGRLPALGGSSHLGTGPDFIAEACEFDRSFLNLSYRTAIVTNIEPDHLDYYRDIDEIVEAFRTFVGALPPDGLLVFRADDPGACRAADGAPVRSEKFAMEGAAEGTEWTARPLPGPGNSFLLMKAGVPVAEGTLRVPGLHNVLDATAAIAGAVAAGVQPGAAMDAVEDFPGVDRRFQVLRDNPDCAIVDDYAHHPTEVRTVLAAARLRFPGRRLCIVFQPHQHSRLRHLLDEFAVALAAADLVIVPDIYVARDPEEERRRISAGDLVMSLRARGAAAEYAPSFGGVLDLIERARRQGDVVITMGAGDIYRVAETLLARRSA